MDIGSDYFCKTNHRSSLIPFPHQSWWIMPRLYRENVFPVDLEGSLACLSHPGRANFSYLVNQLHEKLRKVGSARRVTYRSEPTNQTNKKSTWRRNKTMPRGKTLREKRWYSFSTLFRSIILIKLTSKVSFVKRSERYNNNNYYYNLLY